MSRAPVQTACSLVQVEVRFPLAPAVADTAVITLAVPSLKEFWLVVSPVRPSTHTPRESKRRALPAQLITCQNGDVNLDHVFVCGNPALDFAATLRARRSTRFEMFAAPDRLDAWYRESGVVDAVSPSSEADGRHATTVREAVYQLVTARRLGAEYDTGALAVLN